MERTPPSSTPERSIAPASGLDFLNRPEFTLPSVPWYQRYLRFLLLLPAVLVILGLVVLLGRNQLPAPVSATAGTDAIVGNMQGLLDARFHVSSLSCSVPATGGSCDIASDAIGINPVSWTPVRRVASYDFFVTPDSPSTSAMLTGLEIVMQTTDQLSAVRTVIQQRAVADHLATTTTALQSYSAPSSGYLATYYNNTTICSLSEDGSQTVDEGPTLTFTCAPIDLYTPTAALLEPLMSVYVAARPVFSNPAVSGNWLEVSDSSSDPYIVNSQTPNYQRAVITLTSLSSQFGPSSASMWPAFFYAKDGVWRLMTDTAGGTGNGYLLPCTYRFPTTDAKLAYKGETCLGSNGVPDGQTF